MPPSDSDMKMVRITREAWEALWHIVYSHGPGSGFTLSDAILELAGKVAVERRAMP